MSASGLKHNTIATQLAYYMKLVAGITLVCAKMLSKLLSLCLLTLSVFLSSQLGCVSV